MNVNLSIIRDCDEFEASQLRSVLLFEKFKRENAADANLTMRCILSIVMNGQYKLEDIKRILQERFSQSWTQEYQNAYDSLYNEGLIYKGTDGYLHPRNEDSGYFCDIERKTNALFDSVYKKYLSHIPHNRDPEQIHNYIRQALSLYYKVYGFSFFKVQKKETKTPSILSQLEGLDERSKKCLIAAIGDTLSKPTDEESEILEIWARAFVMTQLAQLDPLLVNFRQQQLSRKSFVLDTDFMLYVMTLRAKYSEEYHSILSYLLKLGCKIYVPEKIRQETIGCIQEAMRKVEEIGEMNVINYSDDYAYSKKSNVFIEDFIALHKEEENEDLSFASYIGNIYRVESNAVFNKKLKKVIGDDNYNRELEMEELPKDLHQRLTSLILQWTQESPKGQDRSYDFNEETSSYDAGLYLTLRNLNKNGEENDMLPFQYYLLTRSLKISVCARNLNIYDKDIICSPSTLTVVLQEIGDINGEAKIINLFDNPFLAYLADASWDKAEPILKAGAQLRYKDIDALRYESEADFHDLLTCKSTEEMKRLAEKYHKIGYDFPSTIAILTQNDKVQKEEIAHLKKENARLKKQLGKNKYEDRVQNISKLFKKKIIKF